MNQEQQRCSNCKFSEVEGRTTHYLVCSVIGSAVDPYDSCSKWGE